MQQVRKDLLGETRFGPRTPQNALGHGVLYWWRLRPSIFARQLPQLSPVCMELGGKNPVYVTKNANLETAVLKLVHNKFLNVGQFCVSPDHVYLDSSINVDEFERL